jgi:hypothetical protein
MTTGVVEYFTQTDPMPYGPGSAFESAYVYASNRPTVMVDPSGLRGMIPDQVNPLRRVRRGHQNVFGTITDIATGGDIGDHIGGVIRASNAAGVDPILVYALIRKEQGKAGSRASWVAEGFDVTKTKGLANIGFNTYRDVVRAYPKVYDFGDESLPGQVSGRVKSIESYGWDHLSDDPGFSIAVAAFRVRQLTDALPSPLHPSLEGKVSKSNLVAYGYHRGISRMIDVATGGVTTGAGGAVVPSNGDSHWNTVARAREFYWREYDNYCVKKDTFTCAG